MDPAAITTGGTAGGVARHDGCDDHAPTYLQSSSSSTRALGTTINVEEGEAASAVTRTCHYWTYVDAKTQESCLVTLFAHYSLHVGFDEEITNAPVAGRRRGASSARREGEDLYNDDGLCGYTWDLLWLPNPGVNGEPSVKETEADEEDKDDAPVSQPCQPVRSRFRFPRSTPLSPSTLQGTGGVLFLSSRDVLIATEAPPLPLHNRTVEHNVVEEAGAASLLLDRFLLCITNDGSCRDAIESGNHEGGGVSIPVSPPASLWSRHAASLALPCPFSSPASQRQSQGCGAAELLLLSGSMLSLLKADGEGATAGAPLLRLVYVAAAASIVEGLGSNEAVVPKTKVSASYELVAAVADLYADGNASVAGGAAAGAPGAPSALKLLVKVRHTFAQPRLDLQTADVQEGKRSGAGGNLHRGHLHRERRSSSATALPRQIRPRDLLWVFVEDTQRMCCCSGGDDSLVSEALRRDGVLLGSIVALLPCSEATMRTITHSSPVDAGLTRTTRGSTGALPYLSCIGFQGAATPYGVIGVSSPLLEGRSRYGHEAGASAQDVAQQLLLSTPERTVFEVAIGRPRERVGPAPWAASDMPATIKAAKFDVHTSVLLLVMDGILSRAHRESERKEATSLPQGLYLTDTPRWDELVTSAEEVSAQGSSSEESEVPLALIAVHRVLPRHTLWCGLEPVRLTSLAVPGLGATPAPDSIWRRSSRDVDDSGADGYVRVWDLLQQQLDDVKGWEALLGRPARVSAGFAFLHNPSDLEGSSGDSWECPVASVTAVESQVFYHGRESTAASSAPTALRAGSAICVYPSLNALTHELTMWYCVRESFHDALPVSASSRTKSTVGALHTHDVVALLAPPLGPVPSRSTSSADEADANTIGLSTAEASWEERVATWVVETFIRAHVKRDKTAASPTVGSGTVATLAAAATYGALRLLWAYAVLHHRCDSDAAAEVPRWPHALMKTVRDTAAEAAQPVTSFSMYAQGVCTCTTALLAAEHGYDSASLAREKQHLQRTAETFFRLLLRTLIELDWDAGHPVGWSCCRWMLRWFLGSTAVGGVVTDKGEKNRIIERREEEEGLAMQVLLYVGSSPMGCGAAPSNDASAPPSLQWLRRCLLLYSCRTAQLPLDLMVRDIVEAAGVSLQDDMVPDELSPGVECKHPPREPRGTATGTAECSTSSPARLDLRCQIEYALLRLVNPVLLHALVHQLAQTTPALYVPLSSYVSTSAPRRASSELKGRFVAIRGLLTVTDLHALVCAGWSASQLRDAGAPPGTAFVCCTVEVAKAALVVSTNTSCTSTALAERYEDIAVAAVSGWGEEGSGDANEASTGRVPLLPVTATLGDEGTEGVVGVSTTRAPFPFGLLPPLLSIYLWYHVVHRLCATLQLLPPMTVTRVGSAIKGRSVRGQEEEGEQQQQQQLPSWMQRITRHYGARLQALHRGLCVLRCLFQDDPESVAENFAIMDFVYATSSAEKGGVKAPWESPLRRHPLNGKRARTSTMRDERLGGRWATLYLVAWQSLLPITVPPLCRTAARAAFRERSLTSLTPHFPTVVRLLRLHYASAGGGRVLRIQLSYAAGMQLSCHRGKIQGVPSPSSASGAAEALLRWRLASAVTMRSPPTSHLVGEWLMQVWANVLLCDRDAVTDVGMYENLYAALAPLQQVTRAGCGADVAFTMLRPCLLYALPIIQQLAVADELVIEKRGEAGREVDVPRQHAQLNMAFVWKAESFSDDAIVPYPSAYAPDRLCAGEVYERVRRQLQRIAALGEGSLSSEASSSCSDSRLTTLARLLSLQPTAVDLTALERRLVRSSLRGHSPEDAAGRDETVAPPGRLSPSLAHSPECRDRSISREHRSEAALKSADDEGEGDVGELPTFYLSAAAAYLTTAAASATIGATSRSSFSGSKRDEKPCGDAAPTGASAATLSYNCGHFVLLCEVLRRELHSFIMRMMCLQSLLEMRACPDEDPSGADAHAGRDGEPRWKLTASDAELKSFINNLADVVVPVARALTPSPSPTFYQSVVLLLLFDVLHHLLGEQEASTAGAGEKVVRVAAPIQQQLRRWIRGAVLPLYENTKAEGKAVVLCGLSEKFFQLYLAAGAADHKNGGSLPGAVRQDSTSPHAASYGNSQVHHEGQRWRHQQRSVPLQKGRSEIILLDCVKACLPQAHQPLWGRAAHPNGAAVADIAPSSGSGWIEVGNTFRASLIHTIGAAVAPRTSQPSARVSSPQTIALEASVSAGNGLPPPSAAPLPNRAHPACGANRGPLSQPLIASCPDAARVDEDARRLLCREEGFKRRQHVDQALKDQHRFLTSPVFLERLQDLYLRLRVEKRRRELVEFAVDQLDLIFAFRYREHDLLLRRVRGDLRRAWCEYGEQQRREMERMFEEEHNRRASLQELARTARQRLSGAAKQELRMWAAYEEGYINLREQEEEARDTLRIDAARGHLAISKRAAEAEEEAYWRAEEEAWAQRQEEGEMAAAEQPLRSSLAPSSTNAPSPSVVLSKREEDPLAKKTRRGGRKGFGSGGGAATLIALHSSSSSRRGGVEAGAGAGDHSRSTADSEASFVQPTQLPPATMSSSPPSAPQLHYPACAPATLGEHHDSDASKRAKEVEEKSWDTVVAQTAARGAVDLFSALSRWQTVLRDTVAPPPRPNPVVTAVTVGGSSAVEEKRIAVPPHEGRGGVAGEGQRPLAAKRVASVISDGTSIAAPILTRSSLSDPTVKAVEQLDGNQSGNVELSNRAREHDDHTTATRQSEADEEETQSVMAVPLPLCGGRGSLLSHSAPLSSVAQTTGMVPLRGAIQNPEAAPHDKPALPSAIAAGSAGPAPSALLKRRKKGFAAAAVPLHLFTSTSATAPPSSFFDKSEGEKRSSGAAVETAAPLPLSKPSSDTEDDPNPARSILPAMEAAAADTAAGIGKDRFFTPHLVASPELHQREGEGDVHRVRTGTAESLPETVGIERAVKQTSAPRAGEATGWGWGDEEGSSDTGKDRGWDGGMDSRALGLEGPPKRAVVTSTSVAAVVVGEDGGDGWGWSDDDAPAVPDVPVSQSGERQVVVHASTSSPPQSSEITTGNDPRERRAEHLADAFEGGIHHDPLAALTGSATSPTRALEAQLEEAFSAELAMRAQLWRLL